MVHRVIANGMAMRDNLREDLRMFPDIVPDTKKGNRNGGATRLIQYDLCRTRDGDVVKGQVKVFFVAAHSPDEGRIKPAQDRRGPVRDHPTLQERIVISS